MYLIEKERVTSTIKLLYKPIEAIKSFIFTGIGSICRMIGFASLNYNIVQLVFAERNEIFTYITYSAKRCFKQSSWTFDIFCSKSSICSFFPFILHFMSSIFLATSLDLLLSDYRRGFTKIN